VTAIEQCPSSVEICETKRRFLSQVRRRRGSCYLFGYLIARTSGRGRG
jgi:hypothetical protein